MTEEVKPSKWAYLGTQMNNFEFAEFLKKAIAGHSDSEHGGVDHIEPHTHAAIGGMIVVMKNGSSFEVSVTRC